MLLEYRSIIKKNHIFQVKFFNNSQLFYVSKLDSFNFTILNYHKKSNPTLATNNILNHFLKSNKSLIFAFVYVKLMCM